MAKTVCDLMVEALVDWGVDTVFGLPGDGINGLMEALRKSRGRVRYVHTRHEEAAAMAAAGYAKFTGRLGVCFATAGPGAVHLLNGLYDAKLDQAPVLAITGMTYHDLIGTAYLQDINQDYLFQDVALYNQRIMGPAHVANVMDLACRAALSHRGVAHVAVPIDYQVANVSTERRSHRNLPGHTSRAFQIPRRIPELPLLEDAAKALSGKRRPAILAGAGARGASRWSAAPRPGVADRPRASLLRRSAHGGRGGPGVLSSGRRAGGGGPCTCRSWRSPSTWSRRWSRAA